MKRLYRTWRSRIAVVLAFLIVVTTIPQEVLLAVAFDQKQVEDSSPLDSKVTVSGNILDENSRPMSGITVSSGDVSGGDRMETKEDGLFELKTEKGYQCDVTVFSPDEEKYRDMFLEIPAEKLNDNYYVGDLQFELREYVLTVSSGDGGSVSCGDSYSVDFNENGCDSNGNIKDGKIALKWGSDITLTVLPDSGFVVDQAVLMNEAIGEQKELTPDKDNLNTVSSVKYTIPEITCDETFRVTFRDHEAPQIENLQIVKPENWGQNKIITFEVSDNVGVKEVNCYYSQEKVTDGKYTKQVPVKLEQIGQDEPNNRHVVKGTAEADENGYYYVSAGDAAGNNILMEVNVDKVDRDGPTVAVTTDNAADCYWQEIAYHIAVEDDQSGVGKVYWKTPDDEEILLEKEDGESAYQYIVSENNTFHVYAKDNVGNKSDEVEVKVENIDREPPVIADLKTQDTWNSQENMVTFTVTDNRKLDNVYYSTVEYKDIKEIKDVIQKELQQENKSLISVEGEENKYSFTVTENGTYYIYTIDNAENMSSCEAKVDHIDLNVPVIQHVEKNLNMDHEESEWHKGSVNIQITVADNGSDYESGIDKVLYSTVKLNKDEILDKADEVEQKNHENTKEDEVRENTYILDTPDEEFNGTYYFWVVDRVGHLSECSRLEVKIDKTAPSDIGIEYVEDVNEGFIKKLINKITFGIFFKEKAVINISARDSRDDYDSGIWYYEYQMVDKGEDVDDHAWIKVSESDEQIQVAINCPPGGFTGNIYVRVCDVAGNITSTVTDVESGCTVIIDNVHGEVPSLDTHGYQDGWVNTDVRLTVSDGNTISGVDVYQYRIEYEDKSIESTDWEDMKETDGTISHYEEGKTVKNQITVREDFNGTIFYRSMSNTTVSGGDGSYSIKVQKTKPENARVTIAEPNGDNGWYTGSYPSITLKEPEVSPYAAPVATYYRLWNTTLGETEEGTREVRFEGNQPLIKEDGVYYLKVWTVDEAGNQCENIYERQIKVDITAPTDLTMKVGDTSIIAKDSSSITYDIFYRETVTVRLAADMDISGLKSLSYQKLRNAAEYRPQGEWTQYSAEEGITAYPSDKFVIYFRAEDMAGNVSIIHSDGLVVDNQAPVGEKLAPNITMKPGDPNSNGLYNGDVVVGVSVFDPRYEKDQPDSETGVFSGLKSITYRIYAGDIDNIESGTLFTYEGGVSGGPLGQDDLVQAWSGNIGVSGGTFNSNNVIVEVTATDNAGNTRTTTTALRIDVTAPQVAIQYDNNSADNQIYFNEDRTATITVTERNFSPSNVNIQITNTEGIIPSVGSWTSSGGSNNGDNTTWTATLTYSADGDYTFAIGFTDMANNPCREETYAESSVAPKQFTIDKTRPSIHVSYDNHPAANDRYFNANRNATVVIEEHNFATDRIEISATKDGVPITLNPSWSGNGDTHTASITYGEDGDYTFDISYIDMAGNENEEVVYSGAAAQDFVVDTRIDKPEILINGVVLTNDEAGEKRAFHDEVVPSVRFQDTNYDHYEISLTRTRKDELDRDITGQFISSKKVSAGSQGGEGSFDVFDRIQDNDGIYSMTVTIWDKAGNEETSELDFIINRFGSVYSYSEYLNSLIRDGGKYVPEVTENLMITEYNADRLLKDSLEIIITCDGKPLTEVHYNKEPDNFENAAPGASGWYEYTYSIDKSNFALDGKYEIAVSSRDRNNSSENTFYEDQAIRFWLDATPPEITSITGLEKPIVNAQEVTADYTVYDTMGLNSVEVYVDGKLVDTKEDFAEDANNYTGSFTLQENSSAQNVRLRVTDLAGNETDTESESFASAYAFSSSITVSTNIFVRWFANKPLFWGTIGGTSAVVVTAAGMGYLVIRKRKWKMKTGNQADK